MTKTLFDLVMEERRPISKEDWSLLGKKQMTDSKRIAQMLEEGYGGLSNEKRTITFEN